MLMHSIRKPQRKVRPDMEAATDGTLATWGNSQGTRLSKEICDALGVKPRTPYHAVADPATSAVVITCDARP